MATKPPAHLREETQKWYRQVTREYDLEPHHVRLLVLACESWDRCQEARERIAAEGMTVITTRGDLKAHPCCAIERQSRVSFMRALRELALDIDPPPESRPPGIQAHGHLQR